MTSKVPLLTWSSTHVTSDLGIVYTTRRRGLKWVTLFPMEAFTRDGVGSIAVDGAVLCHVNEPLVLVDPIAVVDAPR